MSMSVSSSYMPSIIFIVEIGKSQSAIIAVAAAIESKSNGDLLNCKSTVDTSDKLAWRWFDEIQTRSWRD